MKEITFEELIEENFRNDSLLTQMKVEKLLKQVRESTIEECMRIYEGDWGKYTGYKLMEALPTDRIKTEK